MTRHVWFWLLTDLILVLVLFDTFIVLEDKLPDPAPTNGYEIWSH